MMDDEWKPAPPAPRFEVLFGPGDHLPGEPRRPFRPQGYSMSYRVDLPEGNSDAVNAGRPMRWQFIAIPHKSGHDLNKLEATIRRAIPEPDKETAVLQYTEGDFHILLFSPTAARLLRILVQQHRGRECEKPSPGHADRLVMGNAQEWGDMVRAKERP